MHCDCFYTKYFDLSSSIYVALIIANGAPNELKEVTITAVWLSPGDSDIRKFHPWFDATKVPLGITFQIHIEQYFPITHIGYTDIFVGEWPLLGLYAIRYSLSSFKDLIVSQIEYSRCHFNVVQYSMVLHTVLRWLRQKTNKKQSESSNICQA